MGALSDLGHNLRAGLRLSLFLPVELSAYRPGLGQAVWLTLLLTAGWIALDLADLGDEPTVPVEAILAYAAFPVASALAVFAVARLAGAGPAALVLYVVILSIAPVEILLDGLSRLLEGASYSGGTASADRIGTLVFFAWWLAMLARAVRLVFGVTWPKGAGLVAVYLVVHLLVFATPAGLYVWLTYDSDCPDGALPSSHETEIVRADPERCVAGQALTLPSGDAARPRPS